VIAAANAALAPGLLASRSSRKFLIAGLVEFSI
jgi:hypothetical protein